ncbi:hypothetical protein HDU98_011600 [Podochytrium sp. JEL0797]|nr:hypothetical protein HDU98_011600 [Podochytrium sp. JEL0797]
MLFKSLLITLAASEALAKTAMITYFAPNWHNIVTACGKSYPPQDDTRFVALSVFSLSDQSSILASGDCGRCVRIHDVNRGTSTFATVVDVMMRHDAHPDDLDLSNQSFIDLEGSLDAGVVRGLQWDFVDCNGGGAPVKPPPPPPKPTTKSTTPAWVAPTTTSSEWIAPVTTASTTPAWVEPTTTSSEWVAPTTTASSEWVAPTTTASSEWVAPTTSSSVVAPTPTPAAPLTSVLIPGWNYTGCVEDSKWPFGNRVLPVKIQDHNNMTVENCAQYAAEANYTMFGVEWSQECWVGNAFEYIPANLNSTACTMECTGNSTEICGGSLALSVYETFSYTDLGCFEESTPRLLENRLEASEDMTVEKCARLSAAAGFHLFGLQYGVECWGNEGFVSFPVHSDRCDMPCSGNATEKCGAGWALNVYQNDNIN